jgi:hypothetical protein
MKTLKSNGEDMTLYTYKLEVAYREPITGDLQSTSMTDCEKELQVMYPSLNPKLDNLTVYRNGEVVMWLDDIIRDEYHFEYADDYRYGYQP